jgi:hypothetical protein
MVKKIFVFFFIFISVFLPATADISSSVKLTLMNTLSSIGDGDWSLSAIGTGRLTFKSEANRNVKARLSLDTSIADTVLLDVSRAFIKVRFPGFRITMGKDTVSWGEGYFYNAGDVIFGATPTTVDLTADVLRDDAVWLTSAYVPLGTYSFIEPIILAPELNLSMLIADPNAPPPSLEDTSIGGRAVTKISGIKTEAGYLYSGIQKAHLPYLSFQGHLLVDWHLSGSVSIPQSSTQAFDLSEDLVMSFGLFHLQRLEQAGSSSISFRLEGLLRPAASWEQRDSSIEDTQYGLMLYPEISWAMNQSLTLFLRNIVSPIDLSALITAGINWNIYEGFRLLSFLMVQAGEETDLFSLSKPGGFAISTGFQYIY